VSMSHEHGSRDTPAEVLFDIARPSGPLEFMGLLEGLGGSRGKLVGLFNWTCAACGAGNQDTAVIASFQSFLVEWSCSGCDARIVVRFRARSTSDWVAKHALAITGKALCRLADREGPPERPAHLRRKRSKPSQKVFAWIVLPILVILIGLGLTDFRRIRSSLANRDAGRPSGSRQSYSWLGGYWISENSEDVLFFGYMNPAAQCGAYTRVPRDGGPTQIVRFQIVHDEATDDRLVLRELGGSAPSTEQDPGGSGAILYLSRHGTSLIRMTTRQGQPILTNYHHMDRPPGE